MCLTKMNARGHPLFTMQLKAKFCNNRQRVTQTAVGPASPTSTREGDREGGREIGRVGGKEGEIGEVKNESVRKGGSEGGRERERRA